MAVFKPAHQPVLFRSDALELVFDGRGEGCVVAERLGKELAGVAVQHDLPQATPAAPIVGDLIVPLVVVKGQALLALSAAVDGRKSRVSAGGDVLQLALARQLAVQIADVQPLGNQPVLLALANLEIDPGLDQGFEFFGRQGAAAVFLIPFVLQL